MASDLAGNESGAALVEAAMVLPIVLLLVFGLTEVSLYLWTRSLAVKAVQLGARQAVVSSPVAIGPGLDPVDVALPLLLNELKVFHPACAASRPTEAAGPVPASRSVAGWEQAASARATVAASRSRPRACSPSCAP